MLVSAFYDREKMLEIYNLAVKEKYHFSQKEITDLLDNLK